MLNWTDIIPMVKFTTISKGSIWISPRHVDALLEMPGDTAVLIQLNGTEVTVVGSVEDTLKALNMEVVDNA